MRALHDFALLCAYLAHLPLADTTYLDYYTNAARYLGLLDKRKENGTPLYSISENGRSILNKDYKGRQLAFCRVILSHKVFNMTLKQSLDKGEVPSPDEIVGFMKRSNLYRIGSDETYERRSLTIRSWINWILSLINE